MLWHSLRLWLVAFLSLMSVPYGYLSGLFRWVVELARVLLMSVLEN